MMHGLDLNQLRVLEILLKTGSVTLTAAQLGTSQAAVSRSLKTLRTMFDDPLLLKTKSGMVLTKRAVLIAAALPDWLEATRTLQQLSGAAAEAGDGSVGPHAGDAADG